MVQIFAKLLFFRRCLSIHCVKYFTRTINNLRRLKSLIERPFSCNYEYSAAQGWKEAPRDGHGTGIADLDTENKEISHAG